ncbi:hypothetical protein A2U01_0095326 [Trifolium medium]|uniref:Uncharacterized protein n=1 Tax=Trifolium medium TaxID=97028 RepID=A0A392UKR3_9FABA|nr:hypothetical protein [Trifolium medium]
MLSKTFGRCAGALIDLVALPYCVLDNDTTSVNSCTGNDVKLVRWCCHR